MKKQFFTFAFVLVASIVKAVPAFASDPYALWDEARIKTDQQKYPFLYPGFRFLIQPAAQGGASIAGVYDGDGGFTICLSQQNPSNEDVTAAFHCNGRVGAPAIHLPADVVFGHPDKKTKMKNLLKSILWAGLAGGSANTEFPLTAALAQTGENITQQSASAPIISQVRYSKTMSKIQLYAKKIDDSCEENPPAHLAPFAMGDLMADLSSRINDFFKKCDGYGVNLSQKANVVDPQIREKIMRDLDPANIVRDGVVNEDKNDEVFCHEQERNQEMAVIVASTCNIQSVTPQAGEAGNAELWFPGQPITSACKSALLNKVAKDENGNVLLDPNGEPYHFGAPAAAWVYYQSLKVKGIAPTTTDDSTAQHIGACLEKNPKVAAEEQQKFQNALKDAENLVTVDPPTDNSTPPAPSGAGAAVDTPAPKPN